jgi:hypothetical protein
MGEEDDDLSHLQAAVEVIREERGATRALVQAGDRATNKVVTYVGLLAALVAIIASGGPFFLPPWAVALLGVLGGTLGGSAVFMQSRWMTRRALLDGALIEQDDLLLLFSNTAAEIEGRNAAAAQLQKLEPLQLPSPQPERRPRKRGKKAKKKRKEGISKQE